MKRDAPRNVRDLEFQWESSLILLINIMKMLICTLIKIMCKMNFNGCLSFHLCLGLRIGIFLSGFPAKILYALLVFTVYAICSVHRIQFDIINLMSGEEYVLIVIFHPYRSH